MNKLQIFQNSEFGQVRTLEENGKVLFCGSDVAKALGYARPNDAISQHCRYTVKHRIGVETGIKSDGTPAMQNIEMLFIPEGDLYRLIAHSKLPAAEKFERWVFDEVLPSIRKHGMYATEELLENPDLLIKVATALKEEREQRKLLRDDVTRMRPKEIFADAVASSTTTILVGELAKILKQNGVAMGQTRLFGWLRTQGYLIKRSGTDYNMPTQRAMEQCLFEIRETSIVHADGHTSISKTPKVTGKGQQYFLSKFLKDITMPQTLNRLGH